MTTMVVLPYILHRTQDLYPNPEEFIPERFLEGDGKSKLLFGYLPFSAGARNCIGKFKRFLFSVKYAVYLKCYFIHLPCASCCIIFNNFFMILSVTGWFDVLGQKYAMNQMKTVVSTVLRKSRIEALGSEKDIQVIPQIVTRIESLPKLKFHQIWSCLLESLSQLILQYNIKRDMSDIDVIYFVDF